MSALKGVRLFQFIISVVHFEILGFYPNSEYEEIIFIVSLIIFYLQINTVNYLLITLYCINDYLSSVIRACLCSVNFISASYLYLNLLSKLLG